MEYIGLQRGQYDDAGNRVRGTNMAGWKNSDSHSQTRWIVSVNLQHGTWRSSSPCSTTRVGLHLLWRRCACASSMWTQRKQNAEREQENQLAWVPKVISGFVGRTVFEHQGAWRLQTKSEWSEWSQSQTVGYFISIPAVYMRFSIGHYHRR